MGMSGLRDYVRERFGIDARCMMAAEVGIRGQGWPITLFQYGESLWGARQEDLGLDVVCASCSAEALRLMKGCIEAELRRLDMTALAIYPRDAAEGAADEGVNQKDADEGVNPKDAFGDLKAPVDLVPYTGILYEATAFKRGAKKYGPFNWREKKVRARVYGAAMERHLKAWMDGEDYDYDEKTDDYVHHLAAVRACAGIVLDALELDKLADDRVAGPAAGLIRRMLEKDGTR